MSIRPAAMNVLPFISTRMFSALTRQLSALRAGSRLESTAIREILQNQVEQGVEVKGWVKSLRAQKNIAFVSIDDGSSAKLLQVVCPPSAVQNLSVGSSVVAKGSIMKTKNARQPVELSATSVELVGACDASAYPLQPKAHSAEFTRDNAHLRPRLRSFGAALRVRGVASAEIHRFFDEEKFTQIHTPLITTMDCEGAGELFSLHEDVLQHKTQAPKSQTPVSSLLGKAHLTVSGQLHLETAACALGKVYTFNPAFRADYSTTPRHLCEFWMVEPEIAWATAADAMDLAERCVQKVSAQIRHRCADDIALINETNNAPTTTGKQTAGAQAPPAIVQQIPVDDKPFVRMTYDEALIAMKNSGHVFKTQPVWGKRLSTEHEQWLSGKYCNGVPVFVMNFPVTAASFYAKVNETPSPNGPTAATFDLLTSSGELIGGGQREDQYDVLFAKMKQMNIDTEEYSWYLDLRKYGSVPHAGWGLGFERLLLALTGIDNIREVTLVPRAPGMCKM